MTNLSVLKKKLETLLDTDEISSMQLINWLEYYEHLRHIHTYGEKQDLLSARLEIMEKTGIETIPEFKAIYRTYLNLKEQYGLSDKKLTQNTNKPLAYKKNGLEYQCAS